MFFRYSRGARYLSHSSRHTQVPVPATYLIEYPGGRHDFVVWKYGLFNFAQKIFK